MTTTTTIGGAEFYYDGTSRAANISDTPRISNDLTITEDQFVGNPILTLVNTRPLMVLALNQRFDTITLISDNFNQMFRNVAQYILRNADRASSFASRTSSLTSRARTRINTIDYEQTIIYFVFQDNYVQWILKDQNDGEEFAVTLYS